MTFDCRIFDYIVIILLRILWFDTQDPKLPQSVFEIMDYMTKEFPKLEIVVTSLHNDNIP